MALGRAIRADRYTQRDGEWLLMTIALGLTFLVVKFFEYKHKWDLNHIPGPNFVFEGPQTAPQVEIFNSLYFALTGLHALHMVVGVSILAVMTWMALSAPVHAQVVHAGGALRSVLALRRHRLDLSVPAPLPCGPGTSGRLEGGRSRFAEKGLLHDLCVADGVDRHHGVGCVHHSRSAQLSGCAQHCDPEGDAGVLFFMHVKYSSRLTKLVCGTAFFFLLVLFGLTLSDYLSRGWYTAPGGTTGAGTRVKIGPAAPALGER